MDNYLQYITINQGIRFGKPCIKGTRISVSDILKWLASGMTTQEIIKDYPQLLQEHIFAALRFAAQREEAIKILTQDYETVA